MTGRAWKFAAATAVATALVIAGCKTSLFPTQTVANVGCTSRAFWTIVFPPRMICISGLAFWV